MQWMRFVLPTPPRTPQSASAFALVRSTAWASTAIEESIARSRWAAASALGPARARVGLVEEDLPLQVGLLHHVAVDQHEAADARAAEGLGKDAAEGPHAGDEHAGGGDPGLAAGADPGEQLLAVVAVRGGGGTTCGRGIMA